MNQAKGTLTGIRVLDISRMLPGPYCSMVLADHGADVIAVEDRRFQADGLFFKELNRNKRHITCNLKSEKGMEIFLALARRADVLVEGFRPGVAARLGIDYPTLCRMNPGIVYCSITGYGQDGPRRDEAGHDVNYLAAAGLLDLVGEADRAPVIPGIQIADICGGAMQAVTGILLALFARQQSGRGQYIDIAMTDGLLGMLALPLIHRRGSGQEPRRAQTTFSHYFACYNTYETADGRYLAVGALEHRFWRQLCERTGLTAYLDLQYDEPHREEVIEAFRRRFRELSLAQWQEVLAGADCCCSPVRTADEALNDPMFAARGVVLEGPGTGEEIRPFPGIPVKLSATPGGLRTPPTDFGESTREVLGELGYSAPQIDEFFASGAV